MDDTNWEEWEKSIERLHEAAWKVERERLARGEVVVGTAKGAYLVSLKTVRRLKHERH